MRILVTGAAGRLGGHLVQVLNKCGHTVTGVDVVGDQVTRLDVTDFGATRAFVTDLKPEIIIHPAGWTDVEGCAREPEKAITINGFGTQHIALAAAAIGAAVLYVSSNEVFDGKLGRPYREYDEPQPINPYAYSKWVGERALLNINPRHYIVRTSWLFAHGGKNFIQAVLSAVKAGKPLKVVTDEVANPTYNDDLAEAIANLIETERFGIYHLVNEGASSRWAFARYFLDKAGYQDTPVEKITGREYARLSIPPVYSSLNNLAGKLVGITLRPWQTAVDQFLEREGLLK
ncbi:MAG: dTDP-4-dehydrorhamnose reductase [Chloroflexota bacterium]